ncbi:hypothetical protein [Chitiniphilus shinanonensis]|uniref:hypothetical protein n=1 Tax=Chitiniphilus shinanonensis TaxID=553088 RepID=UPI00305DFE44
MAIDLDPKFAKTYTMLGGTMPGGTADAQARAWTKSPQQPSISSLLEKGQAAAPKPTGVPPISGSSVAGKAGSTVLGAAKSTIKGVLGAPGYIIGDVVFGEPERNTARYAADPTVRAIETPPSHSEALSWERIPDWLKPGHQQIAKMRERASLPPGVPSQGTAPLPAGDPFTPRVSEEEFAARANNPTGAAETRAAIDHANGWTVTKPAAPPPGQPQSLGEKMLQLPDGYFQRINQPGQAPTFSNFADPGKALDLAKGNVSGAAWEGDPGMTQAERTAQRVAEILGSTQLQRDLHQARIDAMDTNRLTTPMTPREMAMRMLGSTDIRSQRTGADLAVQLGQQDLARRAAATRTESPLTMAQVRGQQLQNQSLSRRDEMERQLAGLTDANDPGGSKRKGLMDQMILLGYRQPAPADVWRAVEVGGGENELGIKQPKSAVAINQRTGEARPIQPNAGGGSSGYSREDLEHTAKKHNITVEEVLKRLGVS